MAPGSLWRAVAELLLWGTYRVRSYPKCWIAIFIFAVQGAADGI